MCELFSFSLSIKPKLNAASEGSWWKGGESLVAVLQVYMFLARSGEPEHLKLISRAVTTYLRRVSI